MMHSTKYVLKTVTIDGNTWELRRTVGVIAKFNPARLAKVTEYSIVNVTAAAKGEDDARNLWSVSTKAEAEKALKALESKAVVVETTGAEALKRIFG